MPTRSTWLEVGFKWAFWMEKTNDDESFNPSMKLRKLSDLLEDLDYFTERLAEEIDNGNEHDVNWYTAVIKGINLLIAEKLKDEPIEYTPTTLCKTNQPQSHQTDQNTPRSFLLTKSSSTKRLAPS